MFAAALTGPLKQVTVRYALCGMRCALCVVRCALCVVRCPTLTFLMEMNSDEKAIWISTHRSRRAADTGCLQQAACSHPTDACSLGGCRQCL